MTVRAVTGTGIPKPLAPYSPGIDAGGLVFVSGQIGLDHGSGELLDGVEAQAERALKNIVAVLDGAGLTMADVAKVQIFLADINDFNAVNEVYGGYFQSTPPARATVQVAGLPRGALVEIDAIATVG